MAKLISALGRAVQGQDRTSGTVAKVDGNMVSVSTPYGVREYVYSGNARIQSGDRVTINGGNIIGVMRPDSSIPTFHV